MKKIIFIIISFFSLLSAVSEQSIVASEKSEKEEEQQEERLIVQSLALKLRYIKDDYQKKLQELPTQAFIQYFKDTTKPKLLNLLQVINFAVEETPLDSPIRNDLTKLKDNILGVFRNFRAIETSSF